MAGEAKVAKSIIVGVISDTHGLLRPEAVAALRGSELIIHAGDVGRPEVIEELPPSRPHSWCGETSTRRAGRRAFR